MWSCHTKMLTYLESADWTTVKVGKRERDDSYPQGMDMNYLLHKL
jgi:hypothetical protein